MKSGSGSKYGERAELAILVPATIQRILEFEILFSDSSTGVELTRSMQSLLH